MSRLTIVAVFFLLVLGVTGSVGAANVSFPEYPRMSTKVVGDEVVIMAGDIEVARRPNLKHISDTQIVSEDQLAKIDDRLKGKGGSTASHFMVSQEQETYAEPTSIFGSVLYRSRNSIALGPIDPQTQRLLYGEEGFWGMKKLVNDQAMEIIKYDGEVTFKSNRLTWVKAEANEEWGTPVIGNIYHNYSAFGDSVLEIFDDKAVLWKRNRMITEIPSDMLDVFYTLNGEHMAVLIRTKDGYFCNIYGTENGKLVRSSGTNSELVSSSGFMILTDDLNAIAVLSPYSNEVIREYRLQ